jgi:hypothetical protein
LRQRWVNAIERAGEELRFNPYWYFDGGNLVLTSSSSGQTYEVGKHCVCAAAREGQPCKHLALRRLLERYEQARDFAEGVVEPDSPNVLLRGPSYSMLEEASAATFKPRTITGERYGTIEV